MTIMLHADPRGVNALGKFGGDLGLQNAGYGQTVSGIKPSIAIR